MARKATREEQALWRRATSDVAAARRPSPPPEPPAAEPAPPEIVPAPRFPAAVGAGLDRRNAQRLKRGQMAITARLDLHGLTQSEAHGALQRFIARSYDQGRRTLLIITGKGHEGVLRRAVPRWLDEPGLRPMILAREEAQPHHGGAGALYVLLRRRR